MLGPTGAYQRSLPLPFQPAKEQEIKKINRFENTERFQSFQAQPLM